MQRENGSRVLRFHAFGLNAMWVLLSVACAGTTLPANAGQNATDGQSPQNATGSETAETEVNDGNKMQSSASASDGDIPEGDDDPAGADVSPAHDETASADTFGETKVVRFEWCPKERAAESYALPEDSDQHRIVIPKGAKKGGTYPVVIAFHGQPKRGKDPRDYAFMEPVQRQVVSMIEGGVIEPVILVMPVFRFTGSNWPWFQPKQFQEKVIELLSAEGVSAGDWYAFGHSGAAGCGGDGLNQIHLIHPKGVGFFDTCLGEGWQQEIRALQKAKIETFNIHSVETAGFKPKQYPEYQSGFDFGRAYSPLGIEPVECPDFHPGEALRTLPYRCSATKDGVIKSFVVDTGDGAVAHKRLVQPAVEFFMKYFFSRK